MLSLRYRGLESEKSLKMAQMCSNYHRNKVDVPRYSEIFEQIFFSVIRKNSWHTWHRVKLSYYRWYYWLNGVPRVLAQPGTVSYSACATLFVFMKTFLPKNSTYSIRSHA